MFDLLKSISTQLQLSNGFESQVEAPKSKQT